MKKSEFRKVVSDTFNEILHLADTKGEEYSSSPDQFANFRSLAGELDLTMEKVLMVYLAKHLQSVKAFIKDTPRSYKVEMSEPIEGRVDDAIHYLLLLKAMIKEGRDKIEEETQNTLTGADIPF